MKKFRPIYCAMKTSKVASFEGNPWIKVKLGDLRFLLSSSSFSNEDSGWLRRVWHVNCLHSSRGRFFALLKAKEEEVFLCLPLKSVRITGVAGISRSKNEHIGGKPPKPQSNLCFHETKRSLTSIVERFLFFIERFWILRISLPC